MKILLSAHACEPDRGSEYGIGWNWALELARHGHEVHLLTHGDQHRPAIEAFRRGPGLPATLTVVYVEMPWFGRGERRMPKLRWLHYCCWQWPAFRVARRLHRQHRFDVVHHITWGTVRVPSLMGRLGIPFVFGPVAGGESAPPALRDGYGPRGWATEMLRDLSNWVVRHHPLLRRTFREASHVFATSERTKALVPAESRLKTRVRPALGIEREWLRPWAAPRSAPEPDEPLRLLFVARFLSWKGMHLGLPAFARLRRRHPTARLTLVGAGPAEASWRALVDRLGIGAGVTWIPWVDRAALSDLYASHHLLFFPCLHLGGSVVLEAMAHGLPVVCFDLDDGSQAMTDGSCGRSVATRGLTREQAIAGLADALAEIAADRELYRRLSVGALARVGRFEWSRLVQDVYREVFGDRRVPVSAAAPVDPGRTPPPGGLEPAVGSR
jgi:glycosyltransferase involved in cell wall biosynthesis